MCHERQRSITLAYFCFISLVPENVSKAFRQFIQALFIADGESNLNAIGHLIGKTNRIDLSIHITLPRGA